MPELPEVETVRRQLHDRLHGRTIVHTELWRSGREQPVGAAFTRRLEGQRIDRVERRAKLLIWRFSTGGAITAHLKMTGRFVFVEPDALRGKHDRVLFVFDDGQRLVWSDVRQFGFLHLVSEGELGTIFAAYGPEPLETEASVLAERLRAPKTRRLKSALLDQAVIAGVGNIYADEACHRAGLRPMRRLGSLSANDRQRLVEQLQSLLREAIHQNGTSANDYVDTQGERGGFLELLRVYGREGDPCRACGTPIKRIVLAQRGTHYCPTCQA